MNDILAILLVNMVFFVLGFLVRDMLSTKNSMAVKWLKRTQVNIKRIL